MPDDLPLYSETPLRTGLQFADLERFKGADLGEVWRHAEATIAALENAENLQAARQGLADMSADQLLQLHARLFPNLPGAGKLRTASITPRYRGQDCAPPQFIERSLDNMHVWLSSESFRQIHPIEQCALVVARIVDIWPFESGNLTVAIVAGNSFLERSGLGPFSVSLNHRAEFEKAIAQSMTIDMQSLINAIYRTVRKEMEACAGR